MNDKEAENYLNNLSEDPLLDFDPFLVGDGNTSKYDELTGTKPKRFQLSGMDTFNDLISAKKDDELIVDDFPVVVDESSSYEDFYEAFFSNKKRCYDLMNYTVIRSKGLTGPVTEKNIILTDSDKYLIQYLFDNSYILNNVINLAQLSAWEDMRISTVQLSTRCKCPMCHCLEGTVIDLKKIKDLVSSRSSIYSCSYNIKPVILNRSSLGFSTVKTINTKSSRVIDLCDAPLEFLDEIRSEVMNLNSTNDIIFTDLSIIEGWSGEVVLSNDSYVLVHNSYVGERSPFDFVKEWVSESNDINAGPDTDEIFYIKGRQSKIVNGIYIDLLTGEVL